VQAIGRHVRDAFVSFLVSFLAAARAPRAAAGGEAMLSGEEATAGNAAQQRSVAASM